MRCIWINNRQTPRHSLRGLIVTWDVFEYKHFIGWFKFPSTINSNMRCIWIFLAYRQILVHTWLIVTWDVFEWPNSIVYDCAVYRLIVTWDVFEFPSEGLGFCPPPWLIVTWDVFEYGISPGTKVDLDD